MPKQSHNLRTRLFVWYLSSLIILAIFFYLVVHILALSYSSELFFIILFILAISGFFIIRRITSSLSKLTYQIKNITSQNLDIHIRGIKSEDEIGELAKAFNDLLDRLSEAFKRERQFIADVAHELRTPLATERSGLEVALMQKRSSDDYRTAISAALEENKHLSSTLNNVLDLAWSETPNEFRKMIRFNLSKLIDELYEIAVKMSQSKKIKVNYSAVKNIYIVGDREKLARAILNIIDNAIKFTSEGGNISITLAKKREMATIIIDDTGQGIVTKDLPYIFNRFYRGSGTDKVFGSGLGLAISKSIVSLHKGIIEVKSRVGQGSVFMISIPAV